MEINQLLSHPIYPSEEEEEEEEEDDEIAFAASGRFSRSPPTHVKVGSSRIVFAEHSNKDLFKVPPPLVVKTANKSSYNSRSNTPSSTLSSSQSRNMHRPNGNGRPTNQLSGQRSTRQTAPGAPPVAAGRGQHRPPPPGAATHLQQQQPAAATDEVVDPRYMNQQNREGLFNYDEEAGEPDEAEPEQELTWRLDPGVSLSDWTIKVFNMETRQPQAYYVHKNVLAVGPRKSEFFVRYFLSHDNVNSNQRSSDIWLENVAAECMPYFLDYIYSTEGKLEITTGTSVGLRHLAQYFGNRVMHQKVMKFILNDLNMDNVLTYYQHSLTVDDEKVTDITAKKCAENILDIDKQHELLMHIDPSFFRRIMGSTCIDTEEKQYHISLLLAEYCLLNKKHLDDQDFTRISSDRYLPVVHYNAALVLLEMEADLVVTNDDNGVVSSLQERCIQDLTDHWQELSDMKQAEVMRVLRKLSSGVVADMLVKAVAKAKNKLSEAKTSQGEGEETGEESIPTPMEDGKAKIVALHTKKVLEGKLAEMESRHKKELDRLKADYEKNLLKLRDVAIEKEKTIASLKREMGRFERMPNEPGGRLMQSGEQQRPDVLPARGGYTADGLVLCKPRGGGKYAVFLYNDKATNSNSSTGSGGSRSSKGGLSRGGTPKGGASKAGRPNGAKTNSSRKMTAPKGQ